MPVTTAVTAHHIAARASAVTFGKPLITNVHRSIVVEAMVDAVLPGEWTWCSADYASHDFVHADGTRLEVKQSAARQSWSTGGSRVSVSAFDIAPRTGQWINGTQWVAGSGRNADIYVLAHHPVADETADHRDPGQWSFYVIPAARLPVQRTIRLAVLKALCEPVSFLGLAVAVDAARHLSREEVARAPVHTPTL